MAYEEAPGLLHHGGELFVCPCGNSEMKVEIATDPLRFWCSCGTYYTENIIASLRRQRHKAKSPKLGEQPIRMKLPSGLYFTCPCGSDEFWLTEEDVTPRQLFCRCGHVYTQAADAPQLEVESAR